MAWELLERADNLFCRPCRVKKGFQSWLRPEGHTGVFQLSGGWERGWDTCREKHGAGEQGNRSKKKDQDYSENEVAKTG